MDKEVKAVWIKSETHKDLKKYCDKNGKKITFVVEQLITEKLNEQRK